MILVFAIAARTPVDADLWWHLKSGEYLFKHGEPLLYDQFSFTRIGEPWINHSWLGQGILFGVYSLAGMRGLSLLVSLVATASMMIAWKVPVRRPVIKSAAIILGSIVASLVWSPRPQIISLLLLSFLNYFLFVHRDRWKLQLIVLVPLFILWSNIHAGYPLGLFIIAAYALGEFIKGVIHRHSPQNYMNTAVTLSLVGVLCFLVVAINPNGIQMWKIPFQTTGMQSLQMFISEWASPDFHDLAQQSILWLLFCTFLAMVVDREKIDPADVVILVLFGYMTFVSRRHCGPLAVVVTPILIRYGASSVDGIIEKTRHLSNKSDHNSSLSEGLAKPVRYSRGINLFIVASLGFVAIMKFTIVTHPVMVSNFQNRYFPGQAVEILNGRKFSGNLLNEYNWGGYIIWSAPGYPVFIDGRTDLYGDEVIGEWRQLMQAEGNWRRSLSKWGIGIVLLNDDRPLVDKLIQDDWEIVYHQDDRILLINGGDHP